MNRCAVCGGCVQKVIDLGPTPIADRLDLTETHPLRFAVCTTCWLAQLLDFLPDETLYGPEYAFRTGASLSAVEYFAEYARWATDLLPRRGFVVEVACNDGTLLRHFADAGHDTLGVDRSLGAATEARARDLKVWTTPFNQLVGELLRRDEGSADLVIANNVLAHVTDPVDFLAGVAEVLAPRGKAVIEVQYLGDLIAGNQFDHIYHQHRFYFSVASLATLAAKVGLGVEQVLHTTAQGGSIRVVLSKNSKGFSVPWDEGWLRRWPTFASFASRVRWIRELLRAMVTQEREAGRSVAGYAATAKATTLLSFTGINLDYIVDTTPNKIGKRLCGIPIVAEGKPDTFLLLAWNYLGGVLRRERAFMERGGRFIVPIPYPMVL